MAFVHVVAGDVTMSQRAQHAHAADTEDDFLAEPVVQIAAIKIVRQGAIPLGILRQIGVEKINRHGKIRRPGYVVLPGSKSYCAALDGHRNPRRHFRKIIIYRPIHRLFDLAPRAVKPLIKIALAIKQGYRNHRHLEVRRGTNGVAGEHAEATAVRRHIGQ